MHKDEKHVIDYTCEMQKPLLTLVSTLILTLVVTNIALMYTSFDRQTPHITSTTLDCLLLTRQ